MAEDERAKPPRKKRWSWRKRLLILFVGFVVTFPIVFRIIGVRISREMIFPVNPTPVVASPSSYPPGYRHEVLEYETADGIRLRGALARGAKSDARPAIVFFHGNGESAEGEGPFASEVARTLEVDVLSAEYRGYGGCGGEPSEDGLYEDGRAAVKALGRPPEKLVIAGWSMGTGVAVELGHEKLGRALVLFAPFTSIDDAAGAVIEDPRTEELLRDKMTDHPGLVGPLLWVARSPLRDLSIGDSFDSASKIGDVDVPVFIVHGTDDEVVHYELGERLAKKAKNAKLTTVAGASHYLMDRPEAMDALRAAIE